MASAFTPPPLTALGGIPIISVPRAVASTSYASHASINLTRLLDRLEAQLDEERPSLIATNGHGTISQISEDSWRATGIAIALTHARTAIDDLRSSSGRSIDVASLNARLQRLTQRYTQQYPAQRASATPTFGRTGNVYAEDFLTQDLLQDSDSDSEFGEHEQTYDGRANEGDDSKVAAIGGVADESEPSEKVLVGQDVEHGMEEYLTMNNLRQRKRDKEKESTTLSKHPDSDASPTALQSERSVQDSLSGELLRMAGILKMNSIKFADALERDRKILEDADEKLQGNLTLMTRTRGRLGEYSRKARGMGWITLGAVAMVTMSWVVMFVVIRLT